MPASPDPATGWLNQKQAAEHLGVSIDTIRRRIRDGSLPAYRLGKRAIRIRATDLDAVVRPIPAVGRRRR